MCVCVFICVYLYVRIIYRTDLFYAGGSANQKDGLRGYGVQEDVMGFSQKLTLQFFSAVHVYHVL